MQIKKKNIIRSEDEYQEDMLVPTDNSKQKEDQLSVQGAEEKLLNTNTGLEDQVKERMLELKQANKKLNNALLREKKL